MSCVRIVGEDDRGRMFSEDEYKKYKETVVPRRLRNRLYVSFAIPGQIDCKLIGPETPCFCTHRYGSPVIHILDVHTHTHTHTHKQKQII